MNRDSQVAGMASRLVRWRRMVSERVGLNSIQGRLTAITLFFIIGTAASMGVVGFKFTANFEHDRFQDHFSLLASYLASNAELGLLLGNKKDLQILAENMLSVSDVQIVEIFDKHDRLIVRQANKKPLTQLDYASAIITTSTMSTAESPYLEADAVEQELGRVAIGYSLTDLGALKKQLALGFLLLSLLLAIVPALLYWQLSRAIRAPLQDVLHVAKEVSQGRMDVRARGSYLLETSTLAGAFNDMLDALQLQRRQLKEANEAVSKQKVLAEVGKFSMMLAHEIKNPLAVIKGSLGVLRKDEKVAPELKTRMFGFLDEEIARVNKLIEDFLIFARPRPPAFQSVSIRKLLDRLEQRIALMDAKVQVANTVKDKDVIFEVLCDLALLERALLNLVRNAIEATADPSAVRVMIACEEGTLIFRVQDDGPGILPEHLDKIFEPFFSKKAKGTGLGLAIARDAVNAHGGLLTAENCRGGGACFALRLPFKDEPDRPGICVLELETEHVS